MYVYSTISRIFKILASKYVFVPYFTWMTYTLFMDLQKNDVGKSSIDFITSGLHLFRNTSPDRLLLYYQIVSCIGIAICYYVLHKSLIDKPWLAEEKVEQEDIRVPKYPYNEDVLQIIVGLQHEKRSCTLIKNPKWLIVKERGMYQNFLITGTIGTGKTASAMYPFAKQIMFYKVYDPNLKAGMLILDVKGNFYEQMLRFAEEAGRSQDIVLIELSGRYKYNPMHKPDLKPLVLANRIKVILGLFSPRGATDGYWLDKAELLIAECIKLCRLYNDGYVSFDEINKLVNNKTYLINKINVLVEDQDIMTNEELDLFATCRDYFENEYTNLAENTLSIIQSVVTQMTQFFYTDPEVRNTFCAPIEQLNFLGFKDVIDRGKIVVLKMNVAQYRNLAKTIAAYMKLDFQTEVMARLVRKGANRDRPVFMISDEYQEFVTSTDAEFYAQSREPKCVNIVATQSYTSLINTLKDRDVTRTVVQNLINKIWLRTDDSYTVEEVQKHLGREDKEKVSKSISESSGDVKKSRILGSLVSDKASISESLNVNVVKEFIFDEQMFTQSLDVFKAICFLSDGDKIHEPTVVHLQPYFTDTVKNKIKSRRKRVLVSQSQQEELNDTMMIPQYPVAAYNTPIERPKRRQRKYFIKKKPSAVFVDYDALKAAKNGDNYTPIVNQIIDNNIPELYLEDSYDITNLNNTDNPLQSSSEVTVKSKKYFIEKRGEAFIKRRSLI